jgi:eukaryotic-like serine/threonine-protein kinase
MVLELSTKGDLESLITKRKEQNVPFTEAEVVRIIVNIILALDELEDRGILHRDLKALNILIFGEDGREYLKISDFGISKCKNSTNFNELTSVISGTIPICSPERFQGISNSDKEDVWALGILAFYLCTFRYPFVGPHI